MACQSFGCLQRKLLSFGPSGVLDIMMPPITNHWKLVLIEIWWFFSVLWVPFVTYPYNLLVCICHSCLLDPTIFVLFFVITIKKLDFITMRFHHAIQHNIWNFSSDLSLKIEKLSHKFKNVFKDLIFLRAKKKRV